jgi:hypothetical protein
MQSFCNYLLFFMPTNLNALIRYKTIDRCLRNMNVKWTIDRLQEECTEALGEARGVYKKVSERTIRDDIRIMRSDILEFNAPIVIDNGGYRYSEPYFSIFKSNITDEKLLQTVYSLLVKNKDSITHPEFYFVLEALAALTNNKMPADINPPSIDKTEIRFFAVPKTNEAKEPEKADLNKEDFDQDLVDFVDMLLAKPQLSEQERQQQKTLYYWSDVLNMIPS